MRGRKPVGPEVAERLNGSEQALLRLRTVLETLAGDLRVQDACTRLGICEARFHEVRQAMLEGALQALEPKPAGRPSQRSAPAEEKVQELTQRVETLEVELKAAQLQQAIAVILPQALAPQPPPAPEKKTPPPSPRRRPRKRRGR